MTVEKHLELGGCTGSNKFTLVKMSHCWNSHVASIIISIDFNQTGKTAVVTLNFENV